MKRQFVCKNCNSDDFNVNAYVGGRITLTCCHCGMESPIAINKNDVWQTGFVTVNGPIEQIEYEQWTKEE